MYYFFSWEVQNTDRQRLPNNVFIIFLYSIALKATFCWILVKTFQFKSGVLVLVRLKFWAKRRSCIQNLSGWFFYVTLSKKMSRLPKLVSGLKCPLCYNSSLSFSALLAFSKNFVFLKYVKIRIESSSYRNTWLFDSELFLFTLFYGVTKIFKSCQGWKFWERSVFGVRMGNSGPRLELARLANQIKLFGIPDSWQAG